MPSIALVILAFALVLRRRPLAGAAALGGALLLKQFALAAVPFFLVLLLVRGVPRRRVWQAVAVFFAVVAAGFLPFVIADVGALWDDTVAYGTGTYRIIGYGLAGLLVGAGAVERDGDYPFALLALLLWVPATAWLLFGLVRSRASWQAAGGLAISLFLLLWLSRVLQSSYLLWPLVFVVVAVVLAAGERFARSTSA
jgi:uncharacterized membrane protein